MRMTLEEQERRAYANGDTTTADLLRVAIDGNDDLIQRLEENLNYEENQHTQTIDDWNEARERADRAERNLKDLRDKIEALRARRTVFVIDSKELIDEVFPL